MKSKLYSIGFLFIFVSCSEHDISPNVKGKEKKATNYFSSNLKTPLSFLYSFYNSSGQLIKRESHTPDAGITNYSIYSQNSRGDLENQKYYEKESGKFILNLEYKYYYDFKSQNYKTEYYFEGILNSLYYSYFDDFGNITLRIDSTLENNEVFNSYNQFDSLNRLVSFSSYHNLQHDNTTIYNYKGAGMDRYFQTFFGEDSLIWIEGEEEFIDKKLIMNRTFNHVDNDTSITRYFYNEYNDLAKETFEKNGDERVRIENQYDGELLIERKRYSLDFSKPSVDYYLTIYEYY